MRHLGRGQKTRERGKTCMLVWCCRGQNGWGMAEGQEKVRGGRAEEGAEESWA